MYVAKMPKEERKKLIRKNTIRGGCHQVPKEFTGFTHVFNGDVLTLEKRTSSFDHISPFQEFVKCSFYETEENGESISIVSVTKECRGLTVESLACLVILVPFLISIGACFVLGFWAACKVFLFAVMIMTSIVGIFTKASQVISKLNAVNQADYDEALDFLIRCCKLTKQHDVS